MAYPPKRFPGIDEKPSRSLSHNSMLNKLGEIKEHVGDAVWGALKESSLGVFVRWTELSYTFQANTVYYFLCHQLAIMNPHEIWSVIDSRPIRFSLNEYADITGINCDPLDTSEVICVEHDEFWSKLNIGHNDGPNLDELDLAAAGCSSWDFEEKMMLGRLFILHVFICGIHHGSRIPLKLAKRVLDPEKFERHPWGRVGFTYLVDSIKDLRLDEGCMTVHGLIHALFIWVLESFPGLGERCGKKRDVIEGPPLLHWKGSRPRFTFEEFFKLEKAIHGEVRVRHMIPVTMENKYPFFPDYDVNTDPRLDKLLDDILSENLVPNSWPTVTEQPKKKRKMKVKLDEEGQSSKKSKGKTKEGVNEKPEVGVENQTSNNSVVGMLESLTLLVNNMNTAFDVRLTTIETKLTSLEGDMRSLLADKVGSGSTKGKADEEANSASFIVEKNEGKGKETLLHVVKKFDFKHDKGSRPSHMALEKKTPPIEKKKKVVVKKEASTSIKTFKRTVVSNPLDISRCVGEDIVDVTEQVRTDALKMASSSEEDDNDLWMAEVFAQSLDLRKDAIDTINVTPMTKRVPTLAVTQKAPYIGNSTVRRIIEGVVPSTNDYDPMTVVEEKKLQALKDYINMDEEEPLGSSNSSVMFFRQIITPREEWEDDQFGWLRDSHIEATMKMFRLRSMLPTSPFRPRVGFWDPWYLQLWIRDYPNFKMSPPKFFFTPVFVDQFKGEIPKDSATHKTWYVDIDNLYGCLNINGNHWVAVDINFVTKRIYVYDSIPTLSKDSEIVEACEPLRRMIPWLLNVKIHETIRKKSVAQFDVRRVKKNVPVNENPGDCGVYSLKYIECLALGWNFDGLDDNNILALRERLGAEIYDEIAETRRMFLSNISRRVEIVVPELKDNSV